jgi:hypothetical protein
MTVEKSGVRAAIAAAMNYVADLKDVLPASRLRLEEVDRDETAGRWLITISFIDTDTLDTRVYKVIEVHPSDNEVLSMKIREPSQALT